MYYLYGVDYHINNILKIIGLKPADYALDYQILLQKCNEYHEQHSGFKVPVLWENTKFISFSYTKKLLAENIYAQNAHLFSRDGMSLSNKLETGYFSDAFCLLQQMDDKLYQLFNLIFKAVIVNKMPQPFKIYSRELPGIGWIDFRDYYSKNDFTELILQQLTNALFLMDNYVHPQVIITKALGNWTSSNIYQHYSQLLMGIDLLIHRYRTGNLYCSRKSLGSYTRLMSELTSNRGTLQQNLPLLSKHGLEVYLRACKKLDFFCV